MKNKEKTKQQDDSSSCLQDDSYNSNTTVTTDYVEGPPHQLVLLRQAKQLLEYFNVNGGQLKVTTNDDEDQLIGDHEIQESEGGEADLHKHFRDCVKNKDHAMFIPVKKFQLKYLPDGYKDNVVYEYIKVIADLTVRVAVKKTSPYRPEFWPNTNASYPFGSKKDSTSLKVGSGSMYNVKRFQTKVNKETNNKKCWCKKCQDSDSPSNVWWEFFVYTATHVVFDNTEALHTRLRLFFDSHESPMVCVDDIKIVNADIPNDLCTLLCVTCDETLGNRLMALWEHHLKVYEKFVIKYRDSESNYNLNFIVSHPHGCSKHVCVGRWERKHKVGDRNFKFSYDTSTCPGSSGARVHCVSGEDKWYSWCDLVHSGTKDGLNYSAVILNL